MQGLNAVVPQAIALTTTDIYCLSQSSPFYLRGEDSRTNGARFSDLGELEQSVGHVFHHKDDAVDLIRSSVCYNDVKASNISVVSSHLQFGGLSSNFGSAEMASPGSGIDLGQFGFMLQKGTMMGGEVSCGALENGPLEKWADSGLVADHCQQTDISTDTDDKNQYTGVHNEKPIAANSKNQFKWKIGDQKALRRLAQNREAAKKSRMRKRAYVQQLENSRLRLTRVEQELKRARKQDISVTSGFWADQSHSAGRNGTLAFDTEYARWCDEHQHLIDDLRSAVGSRVGDSELQLIVDKVMSHYNEIFQLKSIGVKSDVFHILSGMWKTPTERCFMWLGGFRCSELLKILGNHIEPLTKQQLLGICNLRQSSQQTEDALSQGMEALQQSLADSLSSNSLAAQNSRNVTDYMGQMTVAMSNLATLECFVHQADVLRQKTLQQLQRILTTHQAAHAFLAINDFKIRLRTLSSLWLACPKE